MAITAPASLSPHSSMAAAERVVPSFCARAGTRGSRKVHTTSLRAGSRARAIPCATISESHRIGAAEAKEALAAGAHGVPFLIVRGRIGGSAMTAAAVNALARRGL